MRNTANELAYPTQYNEYNGMPLDELEMLLNRKIREHQKQSRINRDVRSDMNAVEQTMKRDIYELKDEIRKKKEELLTPEVREVMQHIKQLERELRDSKVQLRQIL